MVTESAARTPLSRERVLRAAIDLADEAGADALTMRRLAQSLGVEAMSIYYHVANKEALLDGVVDMLVAEMIAEQGGFEFESSPGTWQPVLRKRILAARTVLLRHAWAPPVIETRTTMTPTLVRYFDVLLGILIEGGFSYELGHHALHALGSRALGFNQELFAPDDPGADDEEDMEMLEDLGPQIPYLVQMMAEVVHDDPETTIGWCDDQTEFEFGLDLLLDGLAAKR